MRLLAAWFGNPIEYWPHILGLILVVVLGVFIIRKIKLGKK
jgi:hypothetical protein